MSETLTATQVEELTRPSPYDNSVSFLYKQAIKLGVPVRFVLIRPPGDTSEGSFNLEGRQDVTFTTIFQFIYQLLSQDNTISLTQLWDIISKIRGDSFNPLEMVPIWLHSVPEFRVDNPFLFDQVHVFYENMGEPQRFNKMSEVLEYYNNIWLSEYNQEFKRDLERLRKFVSAQQEISDITPVQHSGITYDAVTVTYDYTTEPGINPLPDIFNAAKTSYVVPFIQYNIRPIKEELEPLSRYYKIYKGRSIDAKPKYTNVVLTTAQAGQTIYLNVWTGERGEESDVQEEARLGKKESFRVTTISYLEPNGPEQSGILRVTISAPHSEEVDEQTIIERVHAHLPTELLPPPKPEIIKETRLSGNFTIYGAELFDIVLFHLIMNDPLFNVYLYLKEGEKSFAVKTRLNIHYRSFSTDITEITPQGPGKSRVRSAVSASINQEMILAGEKVPVQQPDGSITEMKVEENTLSLQIKITRANSRKSAEQFINILTRLFRRYLQQLDEILKMYLNFVPEYKSILQEKMEKRRTGEGVASVVSGGQTLEVLPRRRIGELKKYGGDIFVPGYARVCQREQQPLIIHPSYISIWEERFINRGGEMEKRQVLFFPKDKPLHALVCPDDKYPYPGVKKNKILSNKNIYPYIPCCYAVNQRTKPNSGLNHYLHGTAPPVQPKTTRPSHIAKGDKILFPGRLGYINTSASSFLKRYDMEAGEILRYGIPESANSFIHCVATAMRDPGYIAAQNQEEYTSILRSNLFNQGVRPELLRQELYNMTNEDIITTATDNDKFFDPLLYYRALEVLYDCNIYIFALNDKDRKTRLKTSLLQLPYHKYFHAHPPNPGKPVVIIVRHKGAETNSLEFPQCELIVDKRESEIRMLFDDSMNNLLYSAMEFVARTFSWQILGSTGEEKVPTLTCRINMYSSLNYQMIFGEIPVAGQIIDTSGKARMFSLAPEWADPERKIYSSLRIFINVLPTAPLNVPEFSPEDIAGNLPPYQKIIEMFGDPISATISTDKRFLTGLWFRVGDIQFGFYCPCQEFEWPKFLEQYPDINQSSETAALTIYIPRETQKIEKTPLQRIRQLRRAGRFIDQILKYLYLIAGRPNNIEAFLAETAALLDERFRVDSITIYDVSTLARVLPRGDVKTVLTELEKQVPNMFPGGKVLIYDEKMLKGVKYQLKSYAKKIEGLDIPPSQLRELEGYYSGKEDFSFDPKFEFILSSLAEFDSWAQVHVPSPDLEQRVIQNLKDSIQTRLNVNAFTYQEPYIFQDSGNTILASSYDPRSDHFYLIQNVAGGELERAIQVAYTWYMDKRNSGFFTRLWPRETGLPAHIIYWISPGGGIIVYKNNSNKQENFLEILDYGNRMFAAMLPIL